MEIFKNQELTVYATEPYGLSSQSITLRDLVHPNPVIYFNLVGVLYRPWTILRDASSNQYMLKRAVYTKKVDLPE